MCEVHSVNTQTRYDCKNLVFCTHTQHALQIGSLCDSADFDDEGALARLWAVLLPSAGAWRDASEPERSTRLCHALVSHIAAQQAPPGRLPSLPSRTGTTPRTMPLRSSSLAHTLTRRSTDAAGAGRPHGLGVRRDSAPATPAFSPARTTPPSWTPQRPGRSPARPSAAHPSDASLYSPGAPAVPAKLPEGEAAAADARSADSRSMHSTYTQISAHLDTLLSGDTLRQPPALSSLRSALAHLTPRHGGMSGAMRSRSAHLLAAVAEDPSPTPPSAALAAGSPPAWAVEPPLRQLTASELRTLRRRRVLRGLLSWRRLSRFGPRHHRPPLLDGGWRGAMSHPGSDASAGGAGSPRSSASADGGEGGMLRLSVAHSWAGVCSDSATDDGTGTENDATAAVCAGCGDGGACCAVHEPLERDASHGKHAPDGIGGQSPGPSPTRHRLGSVRVRHEEKSSTGTTAAEEEALPLLHTLLNRVVSHWGAVPGTSTRSE